MSDQEQGRQQLSIRSIYIKDVSFEAPHTPAIFRENKQPTVEMNLGLNTERVQGDTHEVVLTITVNATVDGKTAFLVEIQQAGLFTLRGFEAEQLGPLLGIYCPTVLYPYAREAIANLVAKGGFAQIMLEHVNFEQLYAEHVQQHAASPQA